MADTVVELHNERVRMLSLHIPCATCQAQPSQACRGLEANFYHAARVTPIWVIYRAGYSKGLKDGRERPHD